MVLPVLQMLVVLRCYAVLFVLVAVVIAVDTLAMHCY
jgi:hypothetical protein